MVSITTYLLGSSEKPKKTALRKTLKWQVPRASEFCNTSNLFSDDIRLRGIGHVEKMKGVVYDLSTGDHSASHKTRQRYHDDNQDIDRLGLQAS